MHGGGAQTWLAVTTSLDYELRPVPPPMFTVTRGAHWLITVGDPPVILAVCSDFDVAERIAVLLALQDVADVDALIAVAQDP